MGAADWMHTYRETLGRLTGFKDHGNARARAACPIHGDGPEGADLWLAVGDKGQLLVRCYPRRSDTPACRTDDVMRAIGLELCYLFPDNPSTRPNGKKPGDKPATKQGGGVARKKDEKAVIEAVFKYEDVGADGNWFTSYEVVKKRYSDGGKDFPQRRPNPDYNPKHPESTSNPKYLYELAGKVRWVLYRLRELRAALKESPTRWVFVVEGETDVETLRDMGFTATSCPRGSLKWIEDSFNHELANCNVVVISDEDPIKPPGGKFDAPAEKWYSPGIEHAKQVIRGILPFAKCVKWLRLPSPLKPGWDFTDWKRCQKGPLATIREHVSTMVKHAPQVKTVEDLDDFRPLHFDGSPVPKADTPSLPVDPPAAVPEPVPAAVPAEIAKPVGTLVETTTMNGVLAIERALLELSALHRLAAGPRSVEEWFGTASVGWGRLLNAMCGVPFNPAAVREAAVVLMAQLARGLDEYAPG
jgi:hypothetical protein